MDAPQLSADQIVAMGNDVRQDRASGLMGMMPSQNPFIELNPQIYKKLFQQYYAYTPRLDYRDGLSGMTESVEVGKRKKKLNILNPDFRFEGTNSLVAIYKKVSPGQ